MSNPSKSTVFVRLLVLTRRGLGGVGCRFLGGGGLLAGVLAYVKQVRPDVLVFGVEAVDAAGMTASVRDADRSTPSEACAAQRTYAYYRDGHVQYTPLQQFSLGSALARKS